jgi:DNA-binding LacI/PurR family transcriptional regulator
VAFLGTPSSHWESGPNRERLEGYLDAHREAGRPLPADDYILTGELVDTPSARRAARAALALDPRPAAIVCATDFYAVGVLDELRSLDVKVPAQISVFGFGDVLTFYATNPTLSTVGVDRYEMGRRAVDLLERRLRRDDGPPVTETVPMHLILRQSCPPLLSAGL